MTRLAPASRIAAVAAVLVLLGLGSASYAFAQTLAPSPSDGESGQAATAFGNSLSFSLVPAYAQEVESSNSSFKEGGALIVVSGDQLQVTTSFLGLPNTAFVNVLRTGYHNTTLGTVTTDSDGRGEFKGNVTLPPGTYQIGLLVFVSDMTAPVAVSVPRAFVLTLPLAGEESTTTSHTTTSTTTVSSSSTAHTESSESYRTYTHATTTVASTETSSATGGGRSPWVFRLAAASVADSPQGYRFASSGTAVVSYSAPHSLLNVELGFEDGNPSTAYSAALSLNGTVITVGSMTTNREGGAELHASIQVSPGTYMLGVLVYDDSSFNTGSPVLVMVSDPSTQLASMASQVNNEEASSAGASSTASTITTTMSTINAGEDVEAQIKDAKSNLTIPATVQVTPLSSSTVVLDSRFSISVGQQAGNGLIVAISGTNVTGPRVLLINMSRTSPLALYPALNVTLDGVPVAEASTAVQVLNPVAGDPARYVLVGTATSLQLLVSIPHFSLHLIQVAGVVVNTIQTALELNAPLLAGSLLVVTVAFAGAYLARKRVFSILI